MTPLRTARQAANLTQSALAAQSGVSERTINRCEALGRWPRYAAQRRALCAALGLDWAAVECQEETK